MAKPPPSTPHSDIDGVHRDEKPNIQTAIESGQDAGTVDKDQKRSHGYPDYSNEGPPGSETGDGERGEGGGGGGEGGESGGR